MFCALIGIVPPPADAALKQRIQQEVTIRVKADHGVNVEWKRENDNDDDDNDGSDSDDCCWHVVVEDEGIPTLLMSAISESPATPELLVELVSSASGGDGGSFSCELWASAPAPLPLPPKYGYDNKVVMQLDDGYNNDDNEQDSAWNKLAPLSMREWGLVVQQGLLSDSQVVELRGYVDSAIAAVEANLQVHRPSICVGTDAFRFREIASRGSERFDLHLDPSSSPAGSFVEQYILTHPKVVNLLQQTLGSASLEHIDFDISVVYSRPGAVHQGWHADGDHQKGAIDAGWQSDGWKTRLANVYALCLFIPMIPLDDTVGFTQFWPGSHRNRDLVGFGKVAELSQATWDGKCAAAGDGIWYDYRLFHRGMPNQSDNVVRPVVQILFKKKWYVEKANYGEESLIRTISSD